MNFAVISFAILVTAHLSHSFPECQGSLGMESRTIKNAQITASSQWDQNHAAIQGRLNFQTSGIKQGAWSARFNDKNQWLQIDLQAVYTKVTAVASQGRHQSNQWVTKYTLQFSNDGIFFQNYREEGKTVDEEFTANKDANSIVYHRLNPPIMARYIRFRPVNWNNHISMRVEVFGCKQECQGALGMESRTINNAQITASSQWDQNHAAIQGRLNFQTSGIKQGAWSARFNDKNQWLQIDLQAVYTKVTAVASQGRHQSNQWVTKYTLQFSNDGIFFQNYREEGKTVDEEFTANKDANSIVYHRLNPPIMARYIRFRPVNWNNHISMRVEVFGCKQECQGALGMESRTINNAQITASSQWDQNHAAIQGRLNFQTSGIKQGAWSARFNDKNQWLQIDLQAVYTKVTAVASQGRHQSNQWVTKYTLQFSNDGIFFQNYREEGKTVDEEFTANKDANSIVYHRLNPPIMARYIRFRPVNWNNHISMRVEVFGCKQECQGALGMESRTINNAQITASSQWDQNHAAIQGRLNFQTSGIKQGAWSSRFNDKNQWLQIDLQAVYTKVTAVASQGRHQSNQWVTKYTLQFSNDGIFFQNYREEGKTVDEEFTANKDANSIVYHRLNPPIMARYIRFRPVNWNNHISMRVEVFGCKQECQGALGMESRTINNAQITASSQWDQNHAAIQGRLNFQTSGIKQGAWSARFNDKNQWLQIDLQAVYTKVTAVASQGRHQSNQWVTKYTLQFSNDGIFFQNYREEGKTVDEEFTANKDANSIVYHRLNPPIMARYIRFRPVNWNNHISMRVEVFGCKQECQGALGMESRTINNAQITASSQWDQNHAAIQGRLNFQTSGIKQGAWSARFNDKNQWLQIDLQAVYTKVTAVASQGRHQSNQWVTKYTLQFSNDGIFFQNYREEGKTVDEEFTANKDANSIVYHRLNPPIMARYIRFRPVNWNNHISMRVEVFGCKQECQGALGMESRTINNAQITASSQWDQNHAAIQGRLNFQTSGIKQGAWSARFNDKNQWLQIDLQAVYTKVTAVASQGRHQSNQWVTKYTLQFSNDGIFFQNYREEGKTVDEEFTANKDANSIVYHRLNPPIMARYIRFRPVNWNNHISMRVEVFGCKQECQGALGMESRTINNAQITASSQWDQNHAAIQGRLNFQTSGIKQGAWSARFNDKNQWLQIDLQAVYTKVTAVASQGRHQSNQWVTKYTLQFSNDGIFFQNYREEGKTVDEEFTANKDANSIVYHRLNPPIMARYIRFRPVNWNNHISMRVEVFGCKQDIDECSSNPCQNGATCVNLVGSYRCNCAPGYTGGTCQTDINECSPNPCQNGATCVNGVGSYRCNCAPGYTGGTCQTDINECSPNPCQNGATCVNGVGSYRCNCAPGYTGGTCQTDINECSPNPCQNGATCVNGVGSYRCNCAPGYTGGTCQTDINECSPNPCQNGATCVNLIGSYRCDCAPGYLGSTCQTDINECSPNPCQNGASCVDLVGKYQCNCAAGYTGNNCETDLKKCASNHCKNGATCVNQGGSYQCICAPGFIGVTCEVAEEDECDA
ncbi:uncharacterized protein LOC114977630 isoform X1 [Acropora millepora]|uniref:uncharacterized protein LOC114977630 isoform X1 n=1 Tax=Acropora millepora TaxID=45264 RepID=UPI001CF545D2|nr:uncharacterized protein LOC114977630 isoform X1 [Acropora millepora]XP_044171672.1 uncharacterized protein LOC114977630 isoform X2 [Acropora millepora]XP_044171673.1 uncharacterized protein LOC114977630 isoform X1 [Acropora millepora]